MKLHELDTLIKTVCPIDGLNSNGEIAFTEEATDEQRQVAQALVTEHLPQLEA